MVMLTSICGLPKETFFFCGVHCIDFSENFVRGILDGPLLSLTGCGFWVFIP